MPTHAYICRACVEPMSSLCRAYVGFSTCFNTDEENEDTGLPQWFEVSPSNPNVTKHLTLTLTIIGLVSQNLDLTLTLTLTLNYIFLTLTLTIFGVTHLGQAFSQNPTVPGLIPRDLLSQKLISNPNLNPDIGNGSPATKQAESVT